MEEKSTLYLETSVIGYYTARESNDSIVRGRQEVTHQWWDNHKSEFELFVSKFVVDEVSAGDQGAARERLEMIENIPLLDVRDEVFSLARSFLEDRSSLPEKAFVDALHIAIATAHEVDYLLTWNCKHIANGVLLPRVKKIAENQGYSFPYVCTPDQLLGV